MASKNTHPPLINFTWPYFSPKHAISSNRPTTLSKPNFSYGATEVACIHLGAYVKQVSAVVSGDPNFCSQCQFVFNQTQSTLKPLSPLLYEWCCPCCDTTNTLEMSENEQLPTHSDIQQYIMSPSVDPLSSASSSSDAMKNDALQNLVFVIDTSGSMHMTQEIPGRHNIGFFDKYSRVTHVSRLEALRHGIVSQIDQLLEDSLAAKNTVVHIVNFSDDVHIHYIDSKGEPQTHTFSGLDDLEKTQNKLLHFLTTHQNSFRPVSEHADALKKCVLALDAQGMTALGTALVVGVGVATTRAHSKLIVATDGLANRGDTLQLEQFLSETPLSDNAKRLHRTNTAFLKCMISKARAKGTQIDILSVKGCNAGLSMLSSLTQSTGGTLEMLDCIELQSLSSVVNQQKVIASQAKVRILAPTVTIDLAQAITPDANGFYTIGNITQHDDFLFAFNLFDNAKAPSKSPLPIQIQLFYRDGQHCYLKVVNVQRIISTAQPDKNTLNIPVLSAFVSQKCAHVAQMGHYELAETIAAHYYKIIHSQHDPDTADVQQQVFLQMYQQTMHLQLKSLRESIKKEGTATVNVDNYSKMMLRMHQRSDSASIQLSTANQAKSAYCCIQ